MTALLDKLPKAIKTLSGIATALIGCATLAFIFGFFARKAQLEAAGVPFAFVDYWTYVEFGVLSTVDCITILFSETWAVGILVAVVVLLFPLFEWGRFKRAMRSSFVYLGAIAVTLTLLSVTLLQLFEVRRLTHESDVIHKAQQGVDTVPAVSVFQAFVPDPLEPPDPAGEIAWPTDSFAGWKALEAVVSGSAGMRKLELRPRPYWALEGDTARESTQPLFFLGQWLTERGRLDAERARRLFALLLGTLVWIVGLLIAVGLWHRKLKQVAAGPDEDFTEQGRVWALILRVEQRFKQEIWLASRWVILPVAALGALTVILLMPMAYGSLASNTLSQEMVEVVLNDRDGGGDAAGEATAKASRAHSIGIEDAYEQSDVKAAAISDHRSVHEALDLIDKYTGKTRNERRNMRARLRRMVQVIANDSDSESALRRLETLLGVARMRALDIAEPIRMAWSRLASRLRSSRRGFILAYPRSPNDALKLVEWDPNAREAKWLIFPIPQAWVSEIRVRENRIARDLVDMLGDLHDADFEDRWHGLQELEATGEPLVLEAYMIALFDPSVHVRGWSITRVGQIAASLPNTPVGERRRRYAYEAISRIAYNQDVRPDHRGAAFTSLTRIATGTALVAAACPGLLDTVRGQFGPEPAYVGTAMSSASQLRCEAIGTTIVEQLDKPEWAAGGELLEAVPTALRHDLHEPKAVEALIEISGDPRVDQVVRSSAIGHLANVESGGPFTARVADHIQALLEAPAGPASKLARADGFARTVALQSMGNLGDRRKAPLLARIAANKDEAMDDREMALMALSRIQVGGIEADLLAIARSEAPDKVRGMAIEVLQTGGHPTWLVDGLATLCPPCSIDVCEAVRTTLTSMAGEGSGYARRRLGELPSCSTLRVVGGDQRDQADAPKGNIPDVDDAWMQAWAQRSGTSGKPLLVEIWRQNCSFCDRQRPVTAAVRGELTALGVDIVRFEATRSSQLDAFVDGTPAHLLFVPPGASHKSTGLLSATELVNFVRSNLGSL